MTFTYQQQNIDDQIVSEALGGDARVVDVEATVVGQAKPPRRNKTRTVMFILIAGLLLLGSLGAYLKDQREMNVSPDLAAIMANAAKPVQDQGVDAPASPQGAVQQNGASEQVIESDAAATPPSTIAAAQDKVLEAPADQVAKAAIEPASAAFAVVSEPAAVAAAPVVAPAGAVAATPALPVDGVAAAASQDAQRKLEKLNADIAARKAELDALNIKVGDAKKALAATAAEEKSAKARVAAAKREAQKLAAKPAPAKQTQKPVDRVMAILSDGVVLHDGDVIDVGTSSPKVGGRLTAVNPAAGLIEVNGEARRVVVDPS